MLLYIALPNEYNKSKIINDARRNLIIGSDLRRCGGTFFVFFIGGAMTHQRTAMGPGAALAVGSSGYSSKSNLGSFRPGGLLL
jgi:hypothetical protein